jgi:hypothetical protein
MLVLAIALFVPQVSAVTENLICPEYKWGMIVNEDLFGCTKYYQILAGFFDGMQFSRSHNDAE